MLTPNTRQPLAQIPPAEEIRERLNDINEEARLLRRLLRVAVRAQQRHEGAGELVRRELGQ